MSKCARTPTFGVLVLLWVSGWGSLAQAAPVVVRGSDYLVTTAGTTFSGAQFKGVPIGPGNTDTIVRRLSDANLSGVGSSATIPVELVQLNLVSVNPIDLGAGLGFHYITLQSARGGPASQGQMTIHYNTANDGFPNTPQGTFDSFFDVFFDVRIGALNGPIIFGDMLTLTGTNTPWDADPPPTALLVPGLVGDGAANFHTNRGVDEFDLFPGALSERHPNGAVHNAKPTELPEPGAMAVIGTGLAAVWAASRRRGNVG